MPRVKFDYIVSFSSEDPEHPAANLLSQEVSKRKWLCAAGETSASVVLQLEKAVQIGTVAVGAHRAALLEVLVGRSETPAHPYQVLVASSVFLSPSESRKAEGAGADRVRSFSAAPGAGGAAPGAGGDVWAQRWDRLRLSLSQPYNKHCKFGVSFVHVFTAEGAPAPAPAAPRPLVAPALSEEDDDEDEFKPGELFAQHKRRADTEPPLDTGSQIRRATAQVLRAAGGGGGARLVRGAAPAPAPAPASTGRRDRKRKRGASRERGVEYSESGEGTSRGARGDEVGTSRGTKETRETHDKYGDTMSDKSKENRERTTTDTLKQKQGAGAGAVLAGVVCVLSGYQHPRRGAVRDAALALGARVRRDWGPDCTHLICAFPNTPKLRAVRAAAGGARVPAVTARWLDECARLRRRLPEEWYSTEPARRAPAPPAPPAPPPAHDESEDTDDEIERVLRESRGSPGSRGSPDADDDHRVQGSGRSDTDAGGDTDAEGDTDAGGDTDEEGDTDAGAARTLPPLLRGMVFVPAPAGAHVDRYVRAYGGTILPVEEVEGAAADTVYALCEAAGAGAGAGVRRLRLRWLWRAHDEGRLPPLDTYLIDSPLH